VSEHRVRRVRIDVLLVERGLAPTRAKAQALVMAGAVVTKSGRVEKAGSLVNEDADIMVGDKARFVSRGGDKLDAALETFRASGLEVFGMVTVDIGASTGGFTDCLLSRGATKVYAIDVGYGQLAQVLRTDERVAVRERTNARNLAREDFAEPIDLIVVDASFIGIGQLMPAIARILRQDGALVALVKPQFEAGKQDATRGRGVIRDAAVRERAIAKARVAVIEAGFVIRAEVDSTLAGPKGNLERFLYAARCRDPNDG
jgi:23S rRNA (cytidine1920-2'-O)/16S rRNA (cytidine1409-2'-O)-methyltransferase